MSGPKDIRLNCSHYIIFESPTKRENESICNEHGLDKESKVISNDQELIQSDPTSCPQNQKGNN